MIMKKLSLVLALCAFVAFTSSAQKIKIGLKGGLNFPSASSFDVENLTGSANESSSGWHAGVFGTFKVAMIGIQPEILYSTTNFKDANNNDTKYDFFSLPIIGKFYVLPGLSLQAGPQFGLILTSDTQGIPSNLELSDFVNTSDFSVAVGAGMELPFGLDVHARYLIGLTDLSDDPNLGEIKANTFQVSVGYALVKLGL